MTQPHRSLRRKQAARVAAIQALYAAHFLPQDDQETVEAATEKLLDYYQQAQARGDTEISLKEQPERALLLTLLDSVKQRHAAIVELIESNMAEGWKKERMGALLTAIATVGIAELLARRTHDAAVIIQEYVTLTEAYHEDEAEVKFINGLLASAYTAIHRHE